jgi:hypothetical protein
VNEMFIPWKARGWELGTYGERTEAGYCIEHEHGNRWAGVQSS